MLIQRYNIGGAPLVHFGTISTSCALFGSIMYTFAPKRMLQNIQVAQLTYSSGSISLLKWLCQITQVAQSASPAVCVTQCSHILNPTQPLQLVNGRTSFFHLIWMGNDYQGNLVFQRVPWGPIIGTIRANHVFSDMPEWLSWRILKMQDAEYQIVKY